jgi:sulfite exporter TauE/SafE
MAGLLGSGHCFAMCGGIAASLGVLTAGGRNPSRVRAATEFNLGRMISYGALGAMAAGLMGFAGDLAHWSSAGQALRLATAVMVALLGLRFLFNWRGLDLVERLGARLWQHVHPLALRAGARQDAAGRLLLGLCWGLLPCGLVYTMLLTAASTGQVMVGSTAMLAFGLGTLPSMLGLTLAAPGLAVVLGDRSFRAFVGFSLVLLALWMVFTLTFAGPPGAHTAH